MQSILSRRAPHASIRTPHLVSDAAVPAECALVSFLSPTRSARVYSPMLRANAIHYLRTLKPALCCLLLVCLFGPAVGCALVNRNGPDSKSMVLSRDLSQRGITAIEQQNWQNAEQLLADAVETCSACPEARRYYAETLWHKGDTQGAFEQLDSAVKLAPQDATLRVRLAEMKFSRGMLAEARADADQAIDLDPRLASAWIIRANIERQAGELTEALADFHRALGCDTAKSDVLVEVAELYRQLGEPQRALMSLQSVAQSYAPGAEPPKLLYLSGLAYTALGRYDEALVAYRAAAERGGADPELSFRSAEALVLAEQPDAARQVLQDALALDPSHQPSRQLLERIDVASRPQPPAR